MIVLLGGKKKSGKSEVSLILKNKGYSVLSFAGKLKRSLANASNISEKDFYDNKKKEVLFDCELNTQSFMSYVYVDFKVSVENRILNTRPVTSIRDMMQYVGTDVLRSIEDQIHIRFFLEEIKNTIGNIVIDDGRFLNELQAVKNEFPTDTISIYLNSNKNIKTDSHLSENAVSEKDFDFVIDNDSTIANLKEKVFNLIEL